MGWEVELTTAAVVRHTLSATAGRGSDLKLYHTFRNRLLLLALHWPTGLLFRIAPRLVASEVWRFLVRLTSGTPREGWLQIRAWAGFMRRLPSALRKRRSRRPTGGFALWLQPSVTFPSIGILANAGEDDLHHRDGTAA
jgi:GT2 family glycosyltransferase